VVPLSEAGYSVRVSARNTAGVTASVRKHAFELVEADALDPQAVAASLRGVDIAYYLVHTLGQGADYADRDRTAAEIFAKAAKESGVARIVYLGGLGHDTERLSEHLASRHEVGVTLAGQGSAVIEFRASIVLGSGSTSFEMIRNLTEKIPVMTTPRWVRMSAQPIGVHDVVAYLVAAASIELPDGPSHRIYEIGGADVVSYGDLLRLYAESRQLKRLVIPVPVLSPGLSGWWLYLFTPREATVGRQLAESLRFPTVVTTQDAARDFPDIAPAGARDAMDRAFADENTAFSATRWSDELGTYATPVHLQREGRYIDSRLIATGCPPEAAFDPIACIGAERGWYAFDTLWDIRGFIDILLGGPGHRRGRRDQYALIEGDYLEWWRVERVIAPELLRLHAEMKVPGEGWLQYELTPVKDGTLVRQTAIFDAKGILGRLYWYAVLPLHHFVFNGTLEGIRRECSALVAGPNTCPLPGEWERSALAREAAEIKRS
jgi:uncharacterized protein YbjT (DUF2867 family)